MDNLISDIRAYCAARGINEATFGRYACDDRHVVPRLERGACTLRTAERLRRYMDDNPPAAQPDQKHSEGA